MGNCRSFDMTLLERQSKLDASVPHLEIAVDEKSISTCFPFRTKGITRIIQRGLHSESHGREPLGYLSVIARRVHGSPGWYFDTISILTFGFINLAGFPFASQSWTVELEARIYTLSQRPVKTYSFTSSDTEFGALYWGFVSSSNTEADSELRETAYLKALLNALEKLRQSIAQDASMLVKELRRK